MQHVPMSPGSDALDVERVEYFRAVADYAEMVSRGADLRFLVGGSDYAGFTLTSSGQLQPIAGSTIPLPDGSGPGDVLFNGNGTRLVGVRINTSLIASFAHGCRFYTTRHLLPAPKPRAMQAHGLHVEVGNSARDEIPLWQVGWIPDSARRALLLWQTHPRNTARCRSLAAAGSIAMIVRH